MYRLKFTEDANASIKKLNKKVPNATKKLAQLLLELQEHPRTGTGQVEQLKHFSEETWSRRITKEHRLVYRINDDVVEVLVVSAYGHY
ncbi:MAG: Txe/YoeB family addiction module toxin [Muribaculaceae bacterium]